MGKRCLLLVCKDGTLFKQIVWNLLTPITDHIDMFDSNAQTIADLLDEVSRIDPDVILLEESSPLSMDSVLAHVLLAKPGRPVIVINQEHNWVHTVCWETIQLRSADDLRNMIALV